MNDTSALFRVIVLEVVVTGTLSCSLIVTSISLNALHYENFKSPQYINNIQYPLHFLLRSLRALQSKPKAFPRRSLGWVSTSICQMNATMISPLSSRGVKRYVEKNNVKLYILLHLYR